jgi:hypothetical protein
LLVDEQTNDSSGTAQGKDAPSATGLPQLHSINLAAGGSGGAAYVLLFEGPLGAEGCREFFDALVELAGETVEVHLQPSSVQVGVLLESSDTHFAFLKALQERFTPTIPLTGFAIVQQARNTYEISVTVLGWSKESLREPFFVELKEKLAGTPGVMLIQHGSNNSNFVVTFKGRLPTDPFEAQEQLSNLLGIQLMLVGR